MSAWCSSAWLDSGLQKRLARYAQLYSRIGFVHHFRPLSGQELQAVIERHTHQLGLGLEATGTTGEEVVTAIARVTRGNFRLVERLFAQIERVVQINELPTITPGKLERFFSTVNQLFLSEQPGYSPAGAPAARPELTLPALDTRLRQFLVEVYNRRPHSETGECPSPQAEQG